MSRDEEIRYITRNRKAWRDYEIGDKYEAGIELKGSEVKSIREGKIDLSDAYAVVEGNQVILRNLHISPYKMTTDETQEPLRPRRLLLHKKEIRKLSIRTEQRGMTLIPIAVYLKGNLVKIELALAIGRKKYDKRQAIAKAEADRSIKKALKKDM